MDPGSGMAAGGLFLFLSVLMICVFSFVSVAGWTEARRKEREAYYKAESLRRIAETPSDGAKYVLEIMREEERIRQDRERAQEFKKVEGMKIGGVVTIAVGVALMFFLHSVGGDQRSSAYMVGLIPALVGVALFTAASAACGAAVHGHRHVAAPDLPLGACRGWRRRTPPDLPPPWMHPGRTDRGRERDARCTAYRVEHGCAFLEACIAHGHHGGHRLVAYVGALHQPCVGPCGHKLGQRVGLQR